MKLGFIGVGNMGGAILRGILAKGYVQAGDITISDANSELAHKFEDEVAVKVAANNIALAEACDLIILAVKPFLLGDVLTEIKSVLPGKRILSIAAGWTFQMLQDATDKKVQVLRAMPNTPAMVGEGLTAFCQENTFDAESFEYAKGLFEAVGRVAVVPERLFDGVIAVSGSSPAYIYQFAKVICDRAEELGIDRECANRLFCKTLIGSAHMMMETGKTHQELIDMVTSPGGATFAGLKALSEGDFDQTLRNCYDATTKRAYELGK